MDFHRQKVRLPTNTWTDVLHHGHDRAFVVAGATKDALLEDFQKAIDDAINKGVPLKGWLDKDDTYHPGFLDVFDEIVKKHGWDYKGGRNWRARVIYETNLKTAYAAGRYKQMTDPAVIKAYPYWQYKHGLERVPVNPREEHEGWDGLVLRADDPWWQTYYPPNGWKCGCGVGPVSRAKLKRMGKDGPDKSPIIQYDEREDPGTGEPIQYPAGVDMGWGYAPGRTWADGLVPKEMQKPLSRQLELPRLDNLPAMKSSSKPTKAEPLPGGLPEQAYVKAFLDEFEAEADAPSLYRDAAGHVVIISDGLFKKPDGTSKLNSSRATKLPLLAEALKDPDEIWADWEWHRVQQKWVLRRRYLKAFDNLAGLVVFDYSALHGWRGTTIYNAESGPKRKRKPNFNQLETWRHGALLYRRAEESEQ